MKRMLIVVLLSAVVCLLGTTIVLADVQEPNRYNLNDYEKITGNTIIEFNESPMLRTKVAAGELPPVEQRLPENPLVVEPWEEIGRYGGKMFVPWFSGIARRTNDAPLLETHVAAGVAREAKRLNADLEPGVLEYWEMSDEGRVFTGRIRKGLKWSDGVPVTTEDIRFYWEDVLTNEALTPVMPRGFVTRAPVELKILDTETFQLKFAKPFGNFPKAVDEFWFTPYRLLRPAHFLKDFHEDYADPEELKALMEENKYPEDNWPRFYLDMVGTDAYPAAYLTGKPYGIGYPVLSPWILTKQERDVATEWERNPYYYKIDPEGNQLPYIDSVYQAASGRSMEVVNMEIMSGEIDFIAEGLPLENLTLYMENAERGGYSVMLLPYWRSFSNLLFVTFRVPDDPVLTEIVQDVRFRHALSLAINREEMNRDLYWGLGEPVQYSPDPTSKWYRKEFEEAYAAYDPERANELLDEMGLMWDENHEYRIRADGEKLTLPYTSLGYAPWKGDEEMLVSYWEALGIDLQFKVVGGGTYWTMYSGGQLIASMNWSAEPEPSDKGIYGHPARLIPGWRQWYDTDGAGGVTPPDWIKEVYEARDLMWSTTDPDEQSALGFRIAELQAEYLWYIGTVGRVPVPVIYTNRMGNISVAEELNVHSIMIMESAPQWFIKAE